MVLDEEYLEQLLNTVEPIVGIEPQRKKKREMPRMHHSHTRRKMTL